MIATRSGGGGFVISGRLDAGSPQTFSFGSRADPRTLGVGDDVSLRSERSRSAVVEEGTELRWSVSVVVSEVDVAGNDPDMNGRTATDSGVVTGRDDPRGRTISVGSGSCRVDMSFIVHGQRAD